MTTIGKYPNAMVDFQSYPGPGAKELRSTEVEGYQPVSRIGEVVINAFVDSFEFSTLPDTLTEGQMLGNGSTGNVVEVKAHFHEWATVQPGMICIARKKRTAVFRQYVAAETAVPVVACAACLPTAQEKNYFFAGVARSKSVRGPDDGIGPSVDEVSALSHWLLGPFVLRPRLTPTLLYTVFYCQSRGDGDVPQYKRRADPS